MKILLIALLSGLAYPGSRAIMSAQSNDTILIEGTPTLNLVLLFTGVGMTLSYYILKKWPKCPVWVPYAATLLAVYVLVQVLKLLGLHTRI